MPKIERQRTLVGLDAMRVSVPAAPSVSYQMPPNAEADPLPEIQNSLPSVVVAPRALLPLSAIAKVVDVSMFPAMSTRPVTRLSVPEATVRVPAAAS